MIKRYSIDFSKEQIFPIVKIYSKRDNISVKPQITSYFMSTKLNLKEIEVLSSILKRSEWNLEGTSGEKMALNVSLNPPRMNDSKM